MRSPARWEEHDFPNGLTFLYKQSAGVPLSAGTFLFRTGSRYEAPNEAGLASLTAEVLLQGTRTRSARRIAETVEGGGASIGVHAAEDYTQASFLSPSHFLETLFDVLADALIHPTFLPAELEKERTTALAALKSRQDNIFNVAYDAFNQTLFGDHPYSRPIDGRPDTIKKFKSADLKRWHQQYFRPDRCILAMIGSLSSAEAKHLIQRHLGRWLRSTKTGADAQAAPIPLARAQANQITARFEQSYLMTGVAAPSVHDPEYLTLKVLNTFFGSGMSSRLFFKLREEMGLAYEVSSFSPAHVQASQWVSYIGTPPEKLSIAKKALERLLDQLARRGPARSEVEQAVSMLHGGYLMESQTRRKQAWYAAWWRFLGRSPDYGQTYISQIKKITPQAVHTLARRLLAQPRVTIEVRPA
jgi:predicted Zn-dependent peptidase